MKVNAVEEHELLLNDDVTMGGELWKEHPPWYWQAWNKWLNVSEAAVETPEIPKCPSAVEHGWGK